MASRRNHCNRRADWRATIVVVELTCDFDDLAGWDDFSVQVFDTRAEVDDFDNFLAPDLDDFDDLAGQDDFTVQVFDKFAEVDDFHNLADFDEFILRVDLADFDLDDFYDLAGWDDFTVQVFDKSA